jgi:hypothetical protein
MPTLTISVLARRVGKYAGRGVAVGVVVMLGTLFGLILVAFVVVLRFDPEARRAATRERGK